MGNETLSVQFEALTSDAKAWDALAERLDGLGSTVGGLSDHSYDFGTLAAAASTAYVELVGTVKAYVRQGKESAIGAADGLQAVRRILSDAEDQNHQQTSSLWKPKYED